jgi:hypothetical protein
MQHIRSRTTYFQTFLFIVVAAAVALAVSNREVVSLDIQLFLVISFVVVFLGFAYHKRSESFVTKRTREIFEQLAAGKSIKLKPAIEAILHGKPDWRIK